MPKLKIPVRRCMPRVDRSGMAVFTHLIRAPDDPDETIVRGKKGGLSSTAWRSERRTKDASDWKSLILQHVQDGKRRTFNRLMVELTGRTADFWFQTPADEALWALVEEGHLLHTMKAPILFWAQVKR